MKREILFRGKRIDNGGWEYGMLFYTAIGSVLHPCIQVVDFEKCTYQTSHEAISESVGQFTGLTDKNGVKIFEGDILNGGYQILKNNGFATSKEIKVKGVVEFINTAQFAIFTRLSKSGDKQYEYFNRLWPLSPTSYQIEVIGNITDNPELLNQ